MKGKPRKLLLQANRNGFYYVLDRTNGKFLKGTPFIKELTWADWLDANCRPNMILGKEPGLDGKRVTCQESGVRK